MRTVQVVLGRLGVVLLACLVGGFALAAVRQGGTDGLAACTSNVKQVGLAVLMYVQDYDETYPPLTTPAHMRNRLMPYVKSKSLFSCPVTGADYLGNPALNYRTMAWLTSPATYVVLRDAKPHTDVGDKPQWVVGYADGHTRSVAEEPLLGKPNPIPPPVPRREQIRRDLRQLRGQREFIDHQIKLLEAEQRKLRGRK